MTSVRLVRNRRRVRCGFERMSMRVRMNVYKQGAKAILTPSPERAETLYL